MEEPAAPEPSETSWVLAEAIDNHCQQRGKQKKMTANASKYTRAMHQTQWDDRQED